MEKKWWKQSMNKRVGFLNFHFKNEILKQCHIVLKIYTHIPVEVEDIYNSLLFQVAREIEWYRAEVDIKAYIGRKSKNLAKNFCRQYISRKYLILNNYVPIVEDVTGEEQEMQLLDFSKLSKKENKIFDLIYIEDRTKKYVAERLSMTRKKLNVIIFQIRDKLLPNCV